MTDSVMKREEPVGYAGASSAKWLRPMTSHHYYMPAV